MQSELVELLSKKKISHPTQIRSSEFSASTGIIKLRGFPWWSDDRSGIEEAEISFRFDGIEESNLSESWFGGDEFHEDLEDFSVEQMNEQVWALGKSTEVYCNAPLEDKFELLAAVDSFLVSSGCPYNLGVFLNMPTIRTFGEFTSSSSYKICSGPKAVCDQVTKELERQNVTYSALEHAPREDNRLLVRLHSGFLICRSAIAIY